jgi:hypothetical protein
VSIHKLPIFIKLINFSEFLILFVAANARVLGKIQIHRSENHSNLRIGFYWWEKHHAQSKTERIPLTTFVSDLEYSQKTNTFELMQTTMADLRLNNGSTIISSAGGTEYAMEGEQWENGVFTYCLLTGLENKEADLNSDKIITLIELQEYLRYKVPELTEGNQQPNSRIKNRSINFVIW